MKKLFSDDNLYLGIVRKLSVDELKTLKSSRYNFYVYLDCKVPCFVDISGYSINVLSNEVYSYLCDDDLTELFNTCNRDHKFKVAIDGAEREVHFLI